MGADGPLLPALRPDLVRLSGPDFTVLWPTAGDLVLVNVMGDALLSALDGRTPVAELLADLVATGVADVSHAAAAVDQVVEFASVFRLLPDDAPRRSAGSLLDTTIAWLSAARPEPGPDPGPSVDLEALDQIGRLWSLPKNGRSGLRFVLTIVDDGKTPDRRRDIGVDGISITVRIKAPSPAGSTIVEGAGQWWHHASRDEAAVADSLVLAVMSSLPSKSLLDNGWVPVDATVVNHDGAWTLMSRRAGLDTAPARERLRGDGATGFSSVQLPVSADASNCLVPDREAMLALLRSSTQGSVALSDITRSVPISAVFIDEGADPGSSCRVLERTGSSPTGWTTRRFRPVRSSGADRQAVVIDIVRRGILASGPSPSNATDASASPSQVPLHDSEEGPPFMVRLPSVKVGLGALRADRTVYAVDRGASDPPDVRRLLSMLGETMALDLGVPNGWLDRLDRLAIRGIGYETSGGGVVLKVYFAISDLTTWDTTREQLPWSSGRPTPPEILALKFRYASSRMNADPSTTIAEYRSGRVEGFDGELERALLQQCPLLPPDWVNVALRLAGFDEERLAVDARMETGGPPSGSDHLLDVSDSEGRRSFDLAGRNGRDVHEVRQALHWVADLAILSADERSRLLGLTWLAGVSRVIGGTTGGGEPFLSLY